MFLLRNDIIWTFWSIIEEEAQSMWRTSEHRSTKAFTITINDANDISSTKVISSNQALSWWFWINEQTNILRDKTFNLERALLNTLKIIRINDDLIVWFESYINNKIVRKEEHSYKTKSLEKVIWITVQSVASWNV